MNTVAQDSAWEAVIGLEVHCQLNTQSKIFSAASTSYGEQPNTHACAVDLALPGVLPVMNGVALRKAVMFGLAIDATVAERCVFDRKHYFYPDLPKGYQISQWKLPIVEHGHLDIEVGGTGKRIGITRAHMEEDAGKSLHDAFPKMTGIDLNRAGTPLIEIVSEPDIRSSAEAVAYLKKLHQIVVYLGISDGNLQEGNFRCDANVSVRRRGAAEFGTRTECKNINSFRYVEHAIDYEIGRQIDVLETGGSIVQETRQFDPGSGTTRTLRIKENADDYRYFPDPDLLPVICERETIEAIGREMPELPEAKRARFEQDYGLPVYDAATLTAERALADYYEAVVAAAAADPKLCANWVMTDLLGALNKGDSDIAHSPVSSDALAGLVRRIADNTISGKIAKDVFESLFADGAKAADAADAVIEAKGLKQITDTRAIEVEVDAVIAANPEQLTQYRAGKDRLFGYFVGQVMKATRGKANPALVNQLLKDKLAG